MKGICPNCEKETELTSLKKKDSVDVQGEPIEVEATLFKCDVCGEEFDDPQSSHDPLESAYHIYRQRHGLLTSEEIKSLRKRYGLTQTELCGLLGWGYATLSRYENGALQDETHDRALRMVMDPRNLLMLVEKFPQVIADEKRKHLIQELTLAEEEEYSFTRIYEERFGRYEPDILSGFRKLDIGKLFNAIVYFCQGGVLKTLLNKLLFYADFVHYREYSLSITGTRYAHIPFGPAPDKYAHYFAELVDEGALSLEEIDFDNGMVGEQYKAVKTPDLTMYSESELKILAMVKEKFKDMTSTEISDLSHKERGYLESKNGEIISYQYADDIKAL